MKRTFWKATLISAAAYTAAGLAGVAVDFRLAAFALVAIQLTWTLFCVARAVQLRLRGGHRPNAESYDRESYGFALGGSISSCALLAVAVALTQ